VTTCSLTVSLWLIQFGLLGVFFSWLGDRMARRDLALGG
jgi:hypothetical protein